MADDSDGDVSLARDISLAGDVNLACDIIGTRKSRSDIAADARYAKLKGTKRKTPAHLIARISEHNDFDATHVKDRIDLDAVACPKLGGSHMNKVVPNAMLRFCFGRRNHTRQCQRGHYIV
jgi:hypothetical protein